MYAGDVCSRTATTVPSYCINASWSSRPKGARHCDRVSVTLRIDRELWEKFKQDELEGLIEDRTATINTWFREMLDKLKRTKVCVDAAENY